MSSTYVSPFAPDAKKGRTDQGVDYIQSSPYKALASGVIAHIDPNFYKGTPAVYIKLDQPITTSDGNTYSGVYYSETGVANNPRTGKPWQPNDKVQAGDPITLGSPAGSDLSEVGFATQFPAGWLPAAHNVYTEGAITTAGSDFKSFVDKITGSPTSSSTSSGWASIPTDLDTAIHQAADAHGSVTPNLLLALWQEETGSTYPNPYVNDKGYGGLFGTPNTTKLGAPYDGFDITASPLAQADLAAASIAAALQKTGGDLAGALSIYSGGGYSSLPGIDQASVTGTPGSGSGLAGEAAGVATNVGEAALSIGNAFGLPAGQYTMDALTGIPIIGPAIGAVESLPGDAGKAISGAAKWLELEIPTAGMYLVLTVAALGLIFVGLNRAAGHPAIGAATAIRAAAA